MTMRIIKPSVVTDSMLVSSTALENDFAVWAAGTAYAAGAKVIRLSTHRVYQRVVAGTTPAAPELDAINWLDIAPTNRWAMFDEVVGTTTTLTEPLTVVLRPGSTGAVALLGLQGRRLRVTLKPAPGGEAVYDKVVVLDGTSINSFYDWFYTDFAQLSDVLLTDLQSHFVNAELTITVSGSAVNGCGVCKFGTPFEVGSVQTGATVGIVDYSKKVVDAFGNYMIVKRAFSKRADLKIFTEAARFNRIFQDLSEIRSTPCIFIAVESPDYAPLVIYGFYKDFSIDVVYPTIHLCSLSLEGLI